MDNLSRRALAIRPLFIDDVRRSVALDAGAGVRRGRRCSTLRAVNRCAGRGPSKDVGNAGHLCSDLHARPWYCSP